MSGPAALVRVGRRWRIIVSPSLDPMSALFAAAHELGHWLLAHEGCATGDAAEERLANYLGAALLAPRESFFGLRRKHGDDLAAIAKALCMTETATALRWAEVLRVPVAVVTPTRVQVRGADEWAWPDETVVRRWVREPIRGIRKTRLTDDPRRIALDASSAAAAG